MNLDDLKRRIETREALGLSAEEFNRMDEETIKQRAFQKRIAIRNAMIAGMNGTEAEIDEALAKVRSLK